MTTQSKYYSDNKVRIAARSVLYRIANKEKLSDRKAAYYATNKQKKINIKRAENPEARRRHQHKRRAIQVQSGGVLSKGLTERLLLLQRNKCACCKKSVKHGHHLDHIMPLALGGTNTDDNIQILCPACNLQKGAKHPQDFMQSRGFLF